ncbi:MAG: peptidylprolyl isomerase [Chitinophagaceae bacterium]
MKKPFFTIFLALFAFADQPSAQTLFTVNDDPVPLERFLTAYRKNSKTDTPVLQELKAYLELYIASQLKIREAKSLGLDTLPQFVAELQSLREQILPQYLSDEAAMTRLVEEAFSRSQKEIKLFHIFIAAQGPDSAAGLRESAEAYKRLQAGETFSRLAGQYSDDPSVLFNGGEVGFVTVFNLPYELENLMYATPAGKTSSPYRSKKGYHIFRNGGERKSLGRIKTAQILIAFPPGASVADTSSARNTVDSLYRRLLKGADFAKLALEYSHDIYSAAANGQVQEFGTGDYAPEFENAAYSLAKDGDISKPFLSAYGWHIVKRLARISVSSIKDEKTLTSIRSRVTQNDRVRSIENAMSKTALAQLPPSNINFKPTALWSYTDSALAGKNPSLAMDTNEVALLQLGKEKIMLSTWIAYARGHATAPEEGDTNYASLFWEQFMPHSAMLYYRKHLEDFNPLFKAQMDELRDGNLFFEIMQQRVWAPAQGDTTALLDFYNANKLNYIWDASADAVIFYASDAPSGILLKKQVAQAPDSWKRYLANLNEKVVADSGRFELAALPNPSKATFKKGLVTALVINEEDKTASFAYINRIYPSREQRSFAEAKALVIADYQATLEKSWIEELKKKYPVKIDEKVWQTLSAK